jgi:hypothetical protein
MSTRSASCQASAPDSQSLPRQQETLVMVRRRVDCRQPLGSLAIRQLPELPASAPPTPLPLGPAAIGAPPGAEAPSCRREAAGTMAGTRARRSPDSAIGAAHSPTHRSFYRETGAPLEFEGAFLREAEDASPASKGSGAGRPFLLPASGGRDALGLCPRTHGETPHVLRRRTRGPRLFTTQRLGRGMGLPGARGLVRRAMPRRRARGHRTGEWRSETPGAARIQTHSALP